MENTYHKIERLFEKVTALITIILGNSITFIIVLGITIYWFCNKQFYTLGIHDSIRDIIQGISFLSLFIIQKSFNRFSGSLHLKVNELVASHKPANNAVINVEEKTEREITELSKEYAEMAELARKIEAKL
jgi:low affinity Fe/Cu permease